MDMYRSYDIQQQRDGPATSAFAREPPAFSRVAFLYELFRPKRQLLCLYRVRAFTCAHELQAIGRAPPNSSEGHDQHMPPAILGPVSLNVRCRSHFFIHSIISESCG
jgi:hypothetical protein